MNMSKNIFVYNISCILIFFYLITSIECSGDIKIHFNMIECKEIIYKNPKTSHSGFIIKFNESVKFERIIEMKPKHIHFNKINNIFITIDTILTQNSIPLEINNIIKKYYCGVNNIRFKQIVKNLSEDDAKIFLIIISNISKEYFFIKQISKTNSCIAILPSNLYDLPFKQLENTVSYFKTIDENLYLYDDLEFLKRHIKDNQIDEVNIDIGNLDNNTKKYYTFELINNQGKIAILFDKINCHAYPLFIEKNHSLLDCTLSQYCFDFPFIKVDCFCYFGYKPHLCKNNMIMLKPKYLFDYTDEYIKEKEKINPKIKELNKIVILHSFNPVLHKNKFDDYEYKGININHCFTQKFT